jgi:hypothetical protein
MAMFDFIIDIWESILHFFGFIVFYFENFIDYIDDGIRLIMRYGTYFAFYMAEQAIIVAFEITSEFLESFNYTDRINSAWSAIPAAPRQILSFLRVPDCVNLVVAALGTRFTLRFVPFLN